MSREELCRKFIFFLLSINPNSFLLNSIFFYCFSSPLCSDTILKPRLVDWLKWRVKNKRESNRYDWILFIKIDSKLLKVLGLIPIYNSNCREMYMHVITVIYINQGGNYNICLSKSSLIQDRTQLSLSKWNPNTL